MQTSFGDENTHTDEHKDVLYVAWILGVEGKAVAIVDGVVIGAAVLLAVGGVLLAPRDRVERAGGAVRNAVLGQQVGVEEVL